MAEIKPFHPAGHYYSPVNDVNSLDRAALDVARKSKVAADICGIEIDDHAMQALWQTFMELRHSFPFSAEQNSSVRYYTNNPFYGAGDAFIFYCMIKLNRPSRVIEIGSGFSSACLLDTLDFEKVDTQCTFVEPYTTRLRSLLTQRDLSRCIILESPVQKTDPDIYKNLAAGDILFIDSTHVLKACSDVAFELFEILPRLNPGVIIHFHDMFWPFEYPTGWLLDKQYSWNELYAVRAFLINNEAFKIEFFNDYFYQSHREEIKAQDLPPVLQSLKIHCGGSLWLRKK